MVRRQVKGKGAVWHILELGGGGEGGTVLRREDCDSGQQATADCGIQRVARFHPFPEEIYTVTISIWRGKKKNRKEEEDHHDFPFHLDQFLVAT